MKILITNDDGINSIGIKQLTIEALKIAAEVLVVCPNEEKSAISQGITIRNNVEVRKVKDLVEGVNTYTLTATPADCVIFAISNLEYKPDVIFSGINNGYNLGKNILYSGTVGSITEGALSGFKGIAFSAEVGCSENIKHFLDIYKYIKEEKLLEKYNLLNINIPNDPKGIKMTKQGKCHEKSYFEKSDKEEIYIPRYYRLENVELEENSDIITIEKGYISISPLTEDRTKY